MTLCNMSIEGGARAGMVAPDDTTFEYLTERGIDPADLEKRDEGLAGTADRSGCTV